MQMAGVDRKPLDEPDEQPRLGAKVIVDQVDVRDLRVKRAVFEPGWHWKRHVSEELCETRHAGYLAEARLRVVMADGAETELRPGDVAVIDPGHDAWTVGEDACVFIDFGESVEQARVAG